MVYYQGILFTCVIAIFICLSNTADLLPESVSKEEFCESCKKVVKAIKKFKSTSDYDEFNVDKACQTKYFNNYNQQNLPKLKRSCHFIMNNYYDEIQETLSYLETNVFQSKLCNEISMACMGLSMPEEKPDFSEGNEKIDDFIKFHMENNKEKIKIAGSYRDEL